MKMRYLAESQEIGYKRENIARNYWFGQILQSVCEKQKSGRPIVYRSIVHFMFGIYHITIVEGQQLDKTNLLALLDGSFSPHELQKRQVPHVVSPSPNAYPEPSLNRKPTLGKCLPFSECCLHTSKALTRI